MNSLLQDPEFIALSKKVSEQSELNLRMALDLEKNTKDTAEIKKDTAEIIQAFKAAKGAFEVLEWTGKVSKVLLPIFLACGSMGYAWNIGWHKFKAFFGLA